MDKTMKSLVAVCIGLFVQTLSVAWAVQRESWTADIDFIKEELPNRHPNLFFHLPQEDFNRSLDSIVNDLDNLDSLAAVVRIREAIAQLGDPHTSFGFYDVVDSMGFYPLSLHKFSDGLYVMETDPAHKGILGTKLVAINSVPVDTVLKRIAPIVPGSEPHFAQQRLRYFVRFYGILRYYGIVTDHEAAFQFVDAAGQPISVILSPVIGVNENVYDDTMVSYKPNKLPYYWDVQSPEEVWIFRDRIFEEDGIYFVQYNRCWGSELEVKYGSPDRADEYPSFQEFADRVVATIETRPISKLLFDLRWNGGGSSPQGTELVKRLSETEVNRRGALFVAIGPVTFSSAVINTMDFKLNTSATFLGLPTGGRPNHYGEVRGMQLPNSKLHVYHSTRYFKYSDEDLPSVYPDISVEDTFEQFNSGIDPIYEAVKMPETRH